MVLVTKERFLFMKSFALLSFIFYACTQILLELTIVQPKEAAYYPLHDALYFLISIQFALQLVWLRKLFLSPRNPRPLSDFPDSWSPSTSAWNRLNPSELQPAEVIVESLQASYVLLYATCNVCFAYANVLWLRENFIFAQLFYIFNAVLNMTGVAFLLNNTGAHSLSRKNWLTHTLVKTSVALGILSSWRGWGTIDNRLHPSISELIETPVIFLLLAIASGPDPTLGLCLVYNFFALAYGPGISERWRNAFKYDIAIVGATVLIDFVAAKLRGITIIRDDTSKPLAVENPTITGEEKKQRLSAMLNMFV